MNSTSTVTIVREILTPIVGGAAGFLAAHGLSLTPDQRAAAVTAGAAALVALERYIVRLVTPKPLPAPQMPPAPAPKTVPPPPTAKS